MDQLEEYLYMRRVLYKKYKHADEMTKGWIREGISQSRGLTVGYLRENKMEVCWREVSCNPCITWTMIRDNLDLQWDWFSVSQNPNVTLDVIRENLGMGKFSWYGLSLNPNITWSFVLEYNAYPWSYTALSLNPNITWQIVQAYPHRPWNVYNLMTHVDPFLLYQANPNVGFYGHLLSKNPRLTWDFISSHEELLENLDDYSMHKCITWDVVKNNMDLKWDWRKVSANPNITWKIICENPDYPWDWCGISANLNVNYKLICENPSTNWYFRHIRNYEGLTWKIISKKIYMPWHMRLVFKHLFFGVDTETLICMKRQKDAARKIQKVWREVVTNPEHPVCRRRLMREFNEMTT